MVVGLIVSGGRGLRMGTKMPKQFLPLDGTPILIRTLQAFDDMDEIDQLILVLPKAFMNYFESLKYHAKKPLHLVEAGEERFASVKNGLLKANELSEDSMVVIHDGVRPLVSQRMILEGISSAKEHGAASAFVRPKDTVKIVGEDGFSKKTLPRETLGLVQTPQCFFTKSILYAHEHIEELDKVVTDDTMMYEHFFGPVYMYPGDDRNLKITTQEDLWIAEAFLKEMK